MKNTQVGIASPNPSYPSPVKVVDGSYDLLEQNKNWFNYNDLASKIQSFTISGNANSFAISGYATYQYLLNLTGQYKITGNWNTSSLNGDVKIIYSDDTNENLFSSYTGSTASGTIDFTSNSSKNIKAIQFKTFSTSSAFTITNLQIEKGSTATSYVAHAQQTQTIDTSPNPLYSENDYYYKQNGNWYVHNEWGKVVLNGTENWLIASSSPTGTKRFYYENEDVYNQGIDWTNKIYIYSDKFKSLTWNDIYADDTTTLNAIANFNNSAGSTGRITIRIEESYASTLNDFKTWLSTHNTTVIYKLATQTNTPITNTTLINQLEALLTLTAYQDQTNISQTHNTAQADMRITAKTIMSMRYLQNEIEELKQAILNS